jgi:putative membrane protein
VKPIPASHLALLIAVALVFTWSGWRPYDRFTWWLEIFPGLLGLAVLVLTYRKFRFTTFCYTLIALHISLLCVGGHYTYARVPAFEWLGQVLGWHRNHYDRLGHFAQGFVPAVISREIFLRLRILNRPRWIPFLILCICLAISASYELIEWGTATLTGSAANDFIGSQGDVWDTQQDMLMALIGATCALILIAPLHDWALRRIRSTTV